jgi:putative DNA primase/helicase
LTAALQDVVSAVGRRLYVTGDLVANVLLHLKALTALDEAVEQPAWIDGRDHAPASEFLTCRNGLLHLPTYLADSPDPLVPPSPAFFSPAASEVSFDPAAPRPDRWHRFLAELWPDDPAAVDLLQEWAGYCLTSDTKFQKILLALGPTRAGKSTVARVLTELVGRPNVAEMSLASLASEFGLAVLLGKTLAVFGDVRLSSRVDRSRLAEKLLIISGGDGLDVNQKFKTIETFRLPTRLMMISNKIPDFDDTVLTKRLLILPFTRSFLGVEDPNLIDDLLAELPGILNWALRGLWRLREQGKFTQPASAESIRDQIEVVNNPVERFFVERLELHPEKYVPSNRLFELYQAWWTDNIDKDPPKNAKGFIQDILAVAPTLKYGQIKMNGLNRRVLYGICLKSVVDR